MEFLALVTIFWFPILLVIFKNITWNLYLWEQKQYRFERFFTFIRWDLVTSNRTSNLYIIKYLIFSIVCAAVISINASIIGILLAFVIWVVEMFLFLDKFFAKEIKGIKINTRNILILLSIFTTICIAIVVSTTPFAIIERSVTTNTQVDLPTIVISDSEQFALVQDIYVYLIIATIFGLFLDIASPLIVVIAVLFTSPYSWFVNQVWIYLLRNKLNLYKRNLIIIGVTGSIGKTVTKELIYDLLKEHYNIIKTADVYTTVAELSRDITKKINKSTQIVLFEVEPFRNGEALAISNILQPDFSILTDIDPQHYGVFKSKKAYLHSRIEMLYGTKSKGYNITSIDNKYVLPFLKTLPGKKIGVTFLDKTSSQLNELYSVKFTEKSIESYSIEMESNNSKLELKTSIHRGSIVKQMIPAIIVAQKLGLSDLEIKNKVKKLIDRFTDIYTLEGDASTLLISTINPDSNLKGILATSRYAYNLKKKFKQKRIILITDGVGELGRLKKKSYAKFVEHLKHKVDYVITTDPLLNDLLSKSHVDLLAFKSKNTQDSIFLARSLIQSGDIIIIEGKDAREIMDSLRGEE